MEENQSLFLAIGLDSKVVESTLKNKKVTQRLKEVIDASGLTKASKAIGILLYGVATKMPETTYHHTKFLIEQVLSENLVKALQLDEGIKYITDIVRKQGGEAQINIEEFNRESGVGIIVTDEEINVTLATIFEENQLQIAEHGASFDFAKIIYKARDSLKWADQKKVMDLIQKKKLEVVGSLPKEEAGKKKKVAPVAPPKEEKKLDSVEEEATTGKNLSDIIGRDIESARNTEELIKKHKAATGGKIMTRFPPEPNGYLHIGHAKAMRFNFTFAKENGGLTYLRYDDTNPVKENQEFIDNIQTCVTWLGYKPYKVTFASDYFQELYDLACELIKRGKAYVDHCQKAEIKEQRNKNIDSPYRERSIDENLILFEQMRQGRMAENECCLRMKIDMKHVNPNMRDPVAYRIRYVPHPHAGEKWCIYPTYDYTHCINDSLENVTHSLCTLEFENRRESYYWLLEALDLFKPMVWEYSRLNLTYTVLSKRKLEKLVLEGHV